MCDAETAECRCKARVVGERCEECGEGTFNLDAANEAGCTRCFCFGQTAQCASAPLFVRAVRYMRASEEEEWSEWALSGKAPAGIRLVDSTERESDSKKLEVCWFYYREVWL